MERPKSSESRYRLIDAFRGLACLMVVIDHAAIPALSLEEVGLAASGWEEALRRWIYRGTRMGLGPSMFFVISGYCVAGSLEKARRCGESAGAFLGRRLWRTFPPYWVALLVLAAVPTAMEAGGLGRFCGGGVGYRLLMPRELDAWQWLGNLTLTETWRPAVAGSYSQLLAGPVWTLNYQEQFYAVCCVAALLAPGRLFRVLGVFTGLLLALRVGAWDCGALTRIEGLFPLFWHEFAVGLAVYWRLQRAVTRGERLAVDLGLAGLWLAGGLGPDPSGQVAAGFGLMLVALRGQDGRLGGLAMLTPLRAIGRRCYSIYLIHLPVVAVGNVVLHEMGLRGFWAHALALVPMTSMLALGAGWGFYRLVETRFQAMPSFGRRGRAEVGVMAAA